MIKRKVRSFKKYCRESYKIKLLVKRSLAQVL